MNRKDEMIDALNRELVLRKDELGTPIQSIYFGGGTPSLLTADEIEGLIDTIRDHYQVAEDPEITLEANPDDLTFNKLKGLSINNINRLSIGVQSFDDNDLLMMNRAHRSDEARECITMAKDLFENISLDLIYGIPNRSLADWKMNLDIFLSFELPHLSAYALTIEPKTAFMHFIENDKLKSVDDREYEDQYRLLLDIMEENDYLNYEFSNFGKEGYFSKNNLNYWQGGTYLGIGPSAHSFDGSKRTWNVRNNIHYIQALLDDMLPNESESLTVSNKFNEHIMTGLRTMWGVSLELIGNRYGAFYKDFLEKQTAEAIGKELMCIENGYLKITTKGKYLSDGLISDLFLVD